MLNLVSTPFGLMGGPAKQGQSNSGAGVFSVGTYLIVGILSVILNATVKHSKSLLQNVPNRIKDKEL